VGIAEDLSKGLIDRFRSLPMARPAFLTGRVIADGIRYALLILLMIVVGVAAGFRFTNGLIPAIAAVALVILFGIALTWIGVFIGISVKNQETAQVAGFVWVFPLVFASSLYVPIATMPTWLQYFANVNPVTSMAGVVRALFIGSNVLVGGASLTKYLWQILVWDAAIMLVFIPLSIRRYVQLAK
jgi:ABC-2 type transport system permease protein/oleandomycin transport system permease protein